MIVVTKHTGQLCNQIWSLLPIISYLEHTKSKAMIFYAREDYVNLFPALRTYSRIKWWLLFDTPHTLSYKILNAILKLVKRYFLVHNISLKKIKSTGLYSVDGWENRHDTSYLLEHKSTIIQLFTPSLKVQEKVSNTIQFFDGITIGMHIRRGDYKEWCNGRYYYSDDVYIRIMHDLALEAKKIGKNIRFLICSNERFNINQINLDVMQIPDSDGITDLYALSKCDYIVGPPSSYSQWASFYGNVPLHMILDPTQSIRLNNFSPIIYLDTFANGNQLKQDEKNESFHITQK